MNDEAARSELAAVPATLPAGRDDEPTSNGLPDLPAALRKPRTEPRPKAGDEVRPLRAARERAGLSLRGLATEIGSVHTYLSGLERGEYTPSVEFARRLAARLGVCVGELGWGDPGHCPCLPTCPEQTLGGEYAKGHWDCPHPLYHLRVAARHSQAELGEKAGRRQGYIGMIERGEVKPSWEAAGALAAVYGKTAVEVFGEPNLCGCASCRESPETAARTYETYAHGHSGEANAAVAREKCQLGYKSWLEAEGRVKTAAIQDQTGYSAMTVSRCVSRTEELATVAWLALYETMARAQGSAMALALCVARFGNLVAVYPDSWPGPSKPYGLKPEAVGVFLFLVEVDATERHREALRQRNLRWWAARGEPGERLGTTPRRGKALKCPGCGREKYYHPCLAPLYTGRCAKCRAKDDYYRTGRLLKHSLKMLDRCGRSLRDETTGKLTSRAKSIWTFHVSRHKGPGSKGKEQAQKVGDRALEIIRERPVRLGTREGRRAIIEQLMVEYEGVEEYGRDNARLVLLHEDGSQRSRRDDPIYRNARKRIDRKLSSALNLVDGAEELLPLLGSD